jgi:hypothetical protein
VPSAGCCGRPGVGGRRIAGDQAELAALYRAPVDLGTPERAQAWLQTEGDNWLAALRLAAAAGEHRRVVDVAEAVHWFSDR